jgi:flagellar motor switch protein FliM
MSLRPGDLLQLPTSITEETQISLNGSPKFIGHIGIENERVAVTLTKVIPKEDISDGRNHG